MGVMPINPNLDGIRNYLEMSLDGDVDPEIISDDLQANIVRIILDNISDMCAKTFRISTQ